MVGSNVGRHQPDTRSVWWMGPMMLITSMPDPKYFSQCLPVLHINRTVSFAHCPHLVHDSQHILLSLWSGSHKSLTCFSAWLSLGLDLLFFLVSEQSTPPTLVHGCCWMSPVSAIRRMKVRRPLETKHVFQQTFSHLHLILISVFVFALKTLCFINLSVGTGQLDHPINVLWKCPDSFPYFMSNFQKDTKYQSPGVTKKMKPSCN